MIGPRTIAVIVIPAIILGLSACVPQQQYDEVVQRNQQLQSELAALQQQHRALQEQHKIVEAADLLFPSGGWRLGRRGRAELNKIVPKLRNLTNAKITVYGYTDNRPVGPKLRREGIRNNLDLSSKRAGAVVTYLASRGVNPRIMSAKGRGETHPVAPNDTPKDRALNRRIEIVLEGPGAY